MSETNLVPLAEAKLCVRNYIDYTERNNLPDALLSFLTLHDDIAEALGITKDWSSAEFERYRVHIGLDLSPVTWRLFVIPVSKEGVEVPYYHEGEPYVYDFNTPCPATCEFESPFNLPHLPPSSK